MSHSRKRASRKSAVFSAIPSSFVSRGHKLGSKAVSTSVSASCSFQPSRTILNPRSHSLPSLLLRARQRLGLLARTEEPRNAQVVDEDDRAAQTLRTQRRKPGTSKQLAGRRDVVLDQAAHSHGRCPRGPPAAVGLGKFAGRRRSPATSAVRLDPRGMVEQRLDDAPFFFDRVLVGEERAVAGERRLKEHFVRGGAFAALPGELHLEADRLRAGRVSAMGIEDQTETGARIEPDDELVRLWRFTLAEERERKPSVEDEAELGLGDRQVLAGADEEGDAPPALAVDPELERCVGLGRRACSDPRGRAVAAVLAAHVAGGVGSNDLLEQATPGRVNGFALPRRFHRRCSEELQEMVDDDVTESADGVVEAASVLDTELLGQCHLDTRDMVPVPDRFQHRVRETHVEELFEPELSEEVVDMEDLLFSHRPVKLRGERLRRGEVVPERLLDDDTSVLRQSRFGETADNTPKERGRCLEVEERTLRGPNRP